MDWLADSELLHYLSVFVGPFVQEDAAVFLAATLSANNPNYFPSMFFVILAGLILSDIWKYWIGWAALKNPRARAFAEKKKVVDLQDKVQRYTLATLFGARFVPFARIPTYVACGFFKVPYWKFCAIVAFTATIYALVIFAFCHLVGEVVGERFEWLLPIAGVTFALLFVGIQTLRNRRQVAKQD
ncbi:VTT domain-containing protein [Hellea sp.]|nr:VTT domain-containing protein [Hellea sp.]